MFELTETERVCLKTQFMFVGNIYRTKWGWSHRLTLICQQFPSCLIETSETCNFGFLFKSQLWVQNVRNSIKDKSVQRPQQQQQQQQQVCLQTTRYIHRNHLDMWRNTSVPQPHRAADTFIILVNVVRSFYFVEMQLDKMWLKITDDKNIFL